MKEIQLVLRYALLCDWLNYDDASQRINWALAMAYPDPVPASGVSEITGIPKTTVLRRLQPFVRSGVAVDSSEGWALTDIGYRWFEEFHRELLRTARGGHRFSPALLNEIRLIPDAQKIRFDKLEVHIFYPELPEILEISLT